LSVEVRGNDSFSSREGLLLSAGLIAETIELFDYNRNILEIRRQHYLETLGRFTETPSIVTVVGLRRVGKSVLLRQFAEEARSFQRVVYIDKESLDFAHVKTAKDIVRHVNATSKRGEDRLVVVDEV
jgi:predicted AAA+ superfamily ATPase